MGIRPGSDVRVIGSQVGHVRSIILSTGDELKPIEAFEEVDPNDIRIVAVLGVKGDFAKFIGPDSKAVLKFDLGGLGSAYFDISRGTKRFGNLGDGAPRILQFEKQADAKEEVFEIVKRIETEIVGVGGGGSSKGIPGGWVCGKPFPSSLGGRVHLGLNLLVGVVIGIRARQRYPCELELRMLGSSIRPMG